MAESSRSRSNDRERDRHRDRGRESRESHDRGDESDRGRDSSTERSARHKDDHRLRNDRSDLPSTEATASARMHGHISRGDANDDRYNVIPILFDFMFSIVDCLLFRIAIIDLVIVLHQDHQAKKTNKTITPLYHQNHVEMMVALQEIIHQKIMKSWKPWISINQLNHQENRDYRKDMNE